MAVITVNAEPITVVKKTLVLELSEAEVTKVVARLNMAPKLADDNGVEMGPAITAAMDAAG